jgi:hypothetical protein
VKYVDEVDLPPLPRGYKDYLTLYDLPFAVIDELVSKVAKRTYPEASSYAWFICDEENVLIKVLAGSFAFTTVGHVSAFASEGKATLWLLIDEECMENGGAEEGEVRKEKVSPPIKRIPKGGFENFLDMPQSIVSELVRNALNEYTPGASSFSFFVINSAYVRVKANVRDVAFVALMRLEEDDEGYYLSVSEVK